MPLEFVPMYLEQHGDDDHNDEDDGGDDGDDYSDDDGDDDYRNCISTACTLKQALFSATPVLRKGSHI